MGPWMWVVLSWYFDNIKYAITYTYQLFIIKNLTIRLRIAKMSSEESIDIDIEINNVFCSFNVRCSLNIEDMIERGVNVELKKNRTYVNMQLREPPAIAKIWQTGKIICMGPKSESDARMLVEELPENCKILDTLY